MFKALDPGIPEASTISTLSVVSFTEAMNLPFCLSEFEFDLCYLQLKNSAKHRHLISCG